MAGIIVSTQSETRTWTRFAPIAVIVLGAGAALVFGRDYLSFSVLAENYQALSEWQGQHRFTAIALYMLIYILAVAFSIPGAVWLSLIGGLMFGAVLGSVMVVISATIGALLIFLAAN